LRFKDLLGPVTRAKKKKKMMMMMMMKHGFVLLHFDPKTLRFREAHCGSIV